MSKDQRLADAIDIVARELIARSLQHAASMDFPGWEEFPDIGENDWRAVCEQAKRVSQFLCATQASYDAAYGFLSDRANEAGG